MAEKEDYETLLENEKFLYDLCKELFEKVYEDRSGGWRKFCDLVGDELAEKLQNAAKEGDDPRWK